MTASEEATLALDLRIQLLETLVGLDTALAKRQNAQEASIARRGQAVLAGIYDALDRSGTDAIKRFLETCMLTIQLDLTAMLTDICLLAQTRRTNHF